MIQTSAELAAAAKTVAQDYKTLYIKGCFGAPLNDGNKVRYANNNVYNRQENRSSKIQDASSETFGFDCVCLIKGLLWGWSGATQRTYGGAEYRSNGVPDISADSMIKKCRDVTEDFTGIQVGELLWMKGHCGIYIGDGLAVEATPKWQDGVQITAVHNIGKKSGFNGRSWKKHGKLPYVTYETVQEWYKLDFPVICKGCKGELVEAVQMLLIQKGYSCGPSGVDGSFGAATEKAIRVFQSDCEMDVSGIVDRCTMGCLLGL